jgi:hypothetical protein
VRRWRISRRAQCSVQAVEIVAGAVVGHDPFDGDAVGGEPGDCAVQEPDAGGGFWVGEDFDVSDSAGVIDTHVHGFPTNSMVVVAGPSSGDAMAGFV